MDKQTLSIMLDSIESAIKNEDTELSLKAMAGLRTFLVGDAVEKVTKDTIKTARRPRAKSFNIYRCVSTDETRCFITGVYHDKEAELAVATNGRIMIQIRSAYRPEHAGEIIHEDGRKLEGKFPNWRGVTPDKKDMEERAVDWADVRSTLDNAKPYIAALKRCRIEKKKREPSIVLHGVRMAYEYTQMACDFVNVYPDAKFYVHNGPDRYGTQASGRSVVLLSGSWKEPEAMLIIMPMAPLEDDDKDFMKKDGLIWEKPLLDKNELNRLRHKDWDKRLQQGIKTEQDEKDEATIKMMADFFNINIEEDR